MKNCGILLRSKIAEKYFMQKNSVTTKTKRKKENYLKYKKRKENG